MPPSAKKNEVRATKTTSTSKSTNKKRKLDADVEKFYAVRAGKKPGVYKTWDECQEQISGFKGAQFKSFLDPQDAKDFVAGLDPKPADADAKPDKFYAVAVGIVPGIYTEWTETQNALKGAKGPKYKKFGTRAEAIEFIKTYGDAAAQKTIEDEPTEPLLKKSKKAKKEPGVLHIYTDGSSLSNGRAGAAAGVGVFYGVNDPRNVCERLAGLPQTNQRAELTAVLRAVEQVPLDQDIRIFTDSKYSIECATNWYKNWEKNDWKTSQGGEVKNRDLVQAIREKIEERDDSGTKTLFQWVKGHNNDVGNTGADELAVRGAKLPKVD